MTVSNDRRARVCCAAAMAAICGARAAAADDSSWVVTGEAARSLHACLTENDDARRLTCYDKALNRPVVTARVPQAKTVPDAKAATERTPEKTPETTPEQRFGMSAAQVVKKEHLAESPKAITAKVVALGHVQGGVLKVALANGQVWAQQNADGQELALHVGDTVTVSHEIAGGFLLTSPSTGHRSMRVRRVQ
jgi:hypothetical protein